MVLPIHIDDLSHLSNTKPIAGRGMAMQVVGDNDINVQCDCYKGLKHLLQD